MADTPNQHPDVWSDVDDDTPGDYVIDCERKKVLLLDGRGILAYEMARLLAKMNCEVCFSDSRSPEMLLTIL